MPGEARPRSAALDAVRVVAVVAVVAGHVWNTPVLHVWLYAWHVPVFFVLTGYLWRPKSAGEEVLGRWRSLGRPYATWLAVLLAAVVAVALATGTFTADTVLEPLAANHAARPFTTFWFVGALFTTALLYRLVRLGAGRLPWLEPTAVVAALAAGALLGPVLRETPLSVGAAVPALALVAAGALLSRIRVDRPVLTGAVLLGVSATALGTGLVQAVDIKRGDWGTPVAGTAVAVAISAGLVLLAQAAFEHLPPAVHRAVIALAAAALVVVLLHPAVLWILHAPRVGDARILLLALVPPWALGLLLVRSPLAPWTAGVARRSGG